MGVSTPRRRLASGSTSSVPSRRTFPSGPSRPRSRISRVSVSSSASGDTATPRAWPSPFGSRYQPERTSAGPGSDSGRGSGAAVSSVVRASKSITGVPVRVDSATTRSRRKSKSARVKRERLRRSSRCSPSSRPPCPSSIPSRTRARISSGIGSARSASASSTTRREGTSRVEASTYRARCWRKARSAAVVVRPSSRTSARSTVMTRASRSTHGPSSSSGASVPARSRVYRSRAGVSCPGSLWASRGSACSPRSRR